MALEDSKHEFLKYLKNEWFKRGRDKCCRSKSITGVRRINYGSYHL